jgi:hypothetical protein
MSRSRPERARRRNRVLGLVAVAALGVVTLAVGPAAEAGKPAPTPAAVIRIDQVSTPTIDVPASAGSADLSYVVKDTPFQVHFTTDGIPLSTSKTTTVVLTVTSGPDQGTVSLTTEVAPGVTQGTIGAAVLPTAANNVTLKVAVDARKTDVTPGTRTIDVLKTSLPAPSTSSLTGIGGGGNIGTACDPTPADPICGDLILPSGSSNGVSTSLLLAQGCGATNCLESYLQVLFGVDSTPPDTRRANPFTFIAKCDKSVCAGKGIKSYKLKVSLDAGVDPVTSPACTAKGVVNSGADFCTDYVQSTRDGAGDVLLYLLFIRDAKIIFG